MLGFDLLDLFEICGGAGVKNNGKMWLKSSFGVIGERSVTEEDNFERWLGH